MQQLLNPMIAAAEPQFLDIISINIWHILISLLNLVILFLIVKRFLFKPVKRLFAERQADIDHQYAAAAEAQRIADEKREAWEQKLESADAEADRRISEATDTAKRRADEIVREADERADGIVRRAEAEAELERKKAEDGIKREIVELSSVLTEKMLGREINDKDHRAMIDDFIDKIGDGNEADRK